MTLEVLSITKNILRSISTNEITTIIDNSPLSNSSQLGLRNNSLVLNRNIVLKDLKLFSRINSLERPDIPEFGLTDSDSERLKKALQLEWNNPRMHLKILLGDNSQWAEIGTLSLLAPGDFNFRQYDLLATIGGGIELGQNFKLGLQVMNVGYGNLQQNDTINIYGYYIDEYYIDNINFSISGGNTDNNNGVGSGGNSNLVDWKNINQSQWNLINQSQWSNF